MINFRQLIDFWGRSQLIQWDEMTISELSIPDSSKNFLVEVGMPHNSDWTITFDTSAKRLQKFHSYFNLFIIGYDDIMPLCLDEQNAGSVIVVEYSNGNVRFVNSCVEFFGYFLMMYQQCRLKGRNLYNEKEIINLIDFTERQMRQQDRTSMSDKEYYWPVIIEQVRAGLL